MSRQAVLECFVDQQELEDLLHEGKPIEFYFEDDNVGVKIINSDFSEEE